MKISCFNFKICHVCHLGKLVTLCYTNSELRNAPIFGVPWPSFYVTATHSHIPHLRSKPCGFNVPLPSPRLKNVDSHTWPNGWNIYRKLILAYRIFIKIHFPKNPRNTHGWNISRVYDLPEVVERHEIHHDLGPACRGRRAWCQRPSFSRMEVISSFFSGDKHEPPPGGPADFRGKTYRKTYRKTTKHPDCENMISHDFTQIMEVGLIKVPFDLETRASATHLAILAGEYGL